MRRAVRAFFVWVMVVAMPLQGMAASAMGSCGPSHARIMQGLMAGAPLAASLEAAEAGHGTFASDHGAHQHATPAHPVGDEPCAGTHTGSRAAADGLSGQVLHHGDFSCSACAACCPALALPASLVLPEPSGPEPLVQVAPIEPVASHQPDGPERPPRTIFA